MVHNESFTFTEMPAADKARLHLHGSACVDVPDNQIDAVSDKF